jgi:hypothetical protein
MKYGSARAVAESLGYPYLDGQGTEIVRDKTWPFREHYFARFTKDPSGSGPAVLIGGEAGPKGWRWSVKHTKHERTR